MSDLYEEPCDLEVAEGCLETPTENGKMAVSLVTRIIRECKDIFWWIIAQKAKRVVGILKGNED